MEGTPGGPSGPGGPGGPVGVISGMPATRAPSEAALNGTAGHANGDAPSRPSRPASPADSAKGAWLAGPAWPDRGQIVLTVLTATANETQIVLNETFPLDHAPKVEQAIERGAAAREALKRLVLDYILAVTSSAATAPPGTATTAEGTTPTSKDAAQTTAGRTEAAVGETWPPSSTTAAPARTSAPLVGGRPVAEVVADGSSVVLYIESGDCTPEIADTISTLEDRAPSDGTEKVVIEMNCRPATTPEEAVTKEAARRPPTTRHRHGGKASSPHRGAARDWKVTRSRQAARKPLSNEPPSPRLGNPQPDDAEIESRFDQRKTADARTSSSRPPSKIKWKVGTVRSSSARSGRAAGHNKNRAKLHEATVAVRVLAPAVAAHAAKPRLAAAAAPSRAALLEAEPAAVAVAAPPLLVSAGDFIVPDAPLEPLYVDEPVEVRLGDRHGPSAPRSTSTPTTTSVPPDPPSSVPSWSLLKIVNLLDSPDPGPHAGRPVDSTELAAWLTEASQAPRDAKLPVTKEGQSGSGGPPLGGPESTPLPRPVTTSPPKRNNFESTAALDVGRVLATLLPLSNTTREPLPAELAFVSTSRSGPPAEGVSHPTSAAPIHRGKSAENATPPDPSSEAGAPTPKNKAADAAPAGPTGPAGTTPVRSSKSDVAKRKVRGRGTPARAEGPPGPGGEGQTTMSPSRRFTAARTAVLDRQNVDECESLCKPKYRTVCAQVGNSTRTFSSLCDVKIEGCITGESTKIRYSSPCSKLRRKKTKVTIEQEEEVRDDEDGDDAAPARTANRTSSVVQTLRNQLTALQ